MILSVEKAIGQQNFICWPKKWSVGGRKIQMNSVRKCCIALKINKKWIPTVYKGWFYDIMWKQIEKGD